MNHSIIYYMYQVFQKTKFHSFKTSKFQSSKHSEFREIKVSKLQNWKNPNIHMSKISSSPNFKMFEFSNSKCSKLSFPKNELQISQFFESTLEYSHPQIRVPRCPKVPKIMKFEVFDFSHNKIRKLLVPNEAEQFDGTFRSFFSRFN